MKKSAAGGQIYLKDIATVEDYHALQRIRTKYNGHEGVRISIFKQAEANAVEVSDLIAVRMEELTLEIPPTIRLERIYDQADYIRLATNGVRDSLGLAAVLVTLVTGFFLTGWRRLLALIFSLPATIMGTFFIMYMLGFSVNIFTLGALVVSMTVVLDNSVVMIENITRMQEQEPGTKKLVTTGALQVSAAITTATLTFMALFIPFLLIPGLSSLLFRELVFTLAIIIFLSMLVSLTITPMFMQLFYPEGRPVSQRYGVAARVADKSINAIISIYEPVLNWSLKHRWFVLMLFLLLLVPGYFFLSKTGAEFLPKADDGLITIKVIMPTGTAMEETDRVLGQIENLVNKQEYVHGYAVLSGGKVWG